MLKLLVSLLLVACAGHLCRGDTADWQENAKIAQLFADSGLQGTFVLYDSAADRYLGTNKARANTRYIPASTFKIANTLIGLSVGAVRDVDEILPYGGRPQPFQTWEKDMSLREAIPLSNVAIYQELARRIGLPQITAAVLKLEYGNGEIGKVVDRFWLDGPLKISAVEQAQFLSKLAHKELLFAPAVQEQVQAVLLLERGEGWSLFGKTGWQNAPEAGVGWWVGWVAKGDRVYSFALNLDVRRPIDAEKRIELGRSCLEVLEILP